MQELIRDEKWKLENGNYKCPHCGIEYKKAGIMTHIWRSHAGGINHNPFKNKKPGSNVWNRGLTKETSESVRRAGETLSKRYSLGELIPSFTGKTHTEKTKSKISEIIKEKVKEGTWHYSFSKTRTFEYDSKYAGKVKLQGKWELEFAKYLDNNNIEWRRPKEKFYYEYPNLRGGCGFYVPDFYLIKEKKYIEIKGYETEKDRAKWKFFPLTLEVIKGPELIEKYKLPISLK